MPHDYGYGGQLVPNDKHAWAVSRDGVAYCFNCGKEPHEVGYGNKKIKVIARLMEEKNE